MTLQQGLVGHWELESTEAKDSSAFDNNGTVGGSPSEVSGQVGGGLNFDGGGDYIDASADMTSITEGDFTVSMWANQDGKTTPAAYGQGVPNAWSNDLFLFYIGDSGENNEVAIYWDGGNLLQYEGEGGGDLGEWNHYTLTRQGDNFELFKNGESVATASKSGSWTSTAQLIGAGNDNGTIKQFYDGGLDDVRVYKRVLSQTEIDQLRQIRVEKRVRQA